MAEPITSSGVEFAANGGTGPGYLSRPQSDGQYPGIVLIQEWWGIDDHIKDVTNRFAGEGYAVLSPDLCHGEVTSEPSEAMKLIQGMDRDRATKELNGAVAYLKSQPFCNGKVGIIGYCMGGGLSISTACSNSDLDACVVYYGGHPDPLDLVENMGCPLLGIYAEHDERVTSGVADLQEALDRHGKQYDVRVYPGTQHAFFNDTRPEIYNAEASKDAWERTLAFFSANLSV